MSEYGANPFVDAAPFYTVILGGLTVAGKGPGLLLLTEVNGVKVEDEWAVDKGTGSSGATSKFKGTKPAGSDLELTFKAYDKSSFDSLRYVWDLLAPVASPGYGIAAAPAADAKPAAAPASGFPVDDTKDKAKAQPNPGPKPPTVSIRNAIVEYIGVTDVARRAWEGPLPQADRTWDVKVSFAPVKPSTPAAVGAAGAAKPDSAVPNGGAPKFGSANGGPSDAAADADAKVGMAGAKP